MRGNCLRGYRAERKAREALEGEGYTVVRSAASKGPFDLVAFNAERVRFVQVKRVKGGRLPPKEAGALRSVPVPPCATRELWVYRDGDGFVERRVV